MISSELIITDPLLHVNSLADRGWTICVSSDATEDTILRELGQIGETFGTRSVGRDGALVEVIQPRLVDKAHPRSLSARYGLDALPFHTELSHRQCPCRYLLFGCIDPGTSNAATMLLDWRTLSFSQEEFDLLEAAPVLVRTGQRSFYSTILSPDRMFFRYDPGCLEAVNERGRAALILVEQRLKDSVPEVHYWRRGDILIIDNWSIMHGRAPVDQGSGRRLGRILIDAK